MLVFNSIFLSIVKLFLVGQSPRQLLTGSAQHKDLCSDLVSFRICKYVNSSGEILSD